MEQRRRWPAAKATKEDDKWMSIATGSGSEFQLLSAVESFAVCFGFVGPPN